MTDFGDSRYISSDESDDNRRSGAKMLPLLKLISKPCRQNGIKLVRCIASKLCGTTWAWKRNKQRILSHAAHECKSVPSDLRQRAREYLSDKAKGPAIELGQDREVSDTGTDDVVLIVEGPTPPTKPKRSGTSSGSQSTLARPFLKEGRKLFKENADHKLMLLITCAGIPPRVADSTEFRAFCNALKPDWTPPCASTISEALIPDEAAKILTAMYRYLGKQRDLTITFDGGKIRRQKSFYSFHVITPSRERFLIELDDASMLSHTANYIVEQMDEVKGLLQRSSFY